MFDHGLLSFLVRWLHVASMAFLLGGTALVWALAWGGGPAAGPRGLLVAAGEIFERFFWLALGIQIATGLGNLGSYGRGLPDPTGPWGITLLVKLSAVLVFVALSLLRTLVLARLALAGDGLAPGLFARAFRWLYGSTTLALAAILLLAVSLAHA